MKDTAGPLLSPLLTSLKSTPHLALYHIVCTAKFNLTAILTAKWTFMLSYLHVWERYVADWGGMESRTYANHYGTKKRLTTSTKNSPPLLKEPESRKAVYSCLGVIVVSP